MRINHPAMRDNPVSMLRWLKYHVGVWMERNGDRLIDHALHPIRCPVCGSPKYDDCECDHIPF